jgi:hypothetical protein
MATGSRRAQTTAPCGALGDGHDARSPLHFRILVTWEGAGGPPRRSRRLGRRADGKEEGGPMNQTGLYASFLLSPGEITFAGGFFTAKGRPSWTRSSWP